MTPESGSINSNDEDEISLIALASLLLRYRWRILRTAGIVTVLTALWALTTPPRYTAAASFLPQASAGGNASLGGLAGLAGQFGIAVPSGGGGESPEFYADLVTSREIMVALTSELFELDDVEASGAPVARGTLSDLLEIKDESENQAREPDLVIRWLREVVAVSTSRQTGVVSLSVTTPWASVSHSIAVRLLELLNGFNLRTRQSQAGAERAFVEGRLAEVQDSLRVAEDRLAAFLESNRQWEGSPELSFQRDRLQRQLLTQQQVFTGLAEAHEQARISELRNTPVITLIDRPVRPARPDPRGRVRTAITGLFVGVGIGVLLAFMKAYSERAVKQDDEDFREFRTEVSRAWSEIRSLFGFRRRV